MQSNDLEKAKSNVVCTLFKQPFSNRIIYGGIFEENGDIQELFESN